MSASQTFQGDVRFIGGCLRRQLAVSRQEARRASAADVTVAVGFQQGCVGPTELAVGEGALVGGSGGVEPVDVRLGICGAEWRATIGAHTLQNAHQFASEALATETVQEEVS